MNFVARFVIFIPVTLFFCSCSKPAAVNVPLSSAEAQTLAESFSRLDKVLAEKAPSLQTNLAPAASDAEIATLRTTLNGTNAVLEAWFRWHNGAAKQNFGLLPLGNPLSIAESLEDRKGIKNIPFVEKLRKNSVKILDDGAGDGFFVDPTAQQPGVFYYMLEDPSPRNFGTMPQFLGFITKGFESGVLSAKPSGELSYDLKTYEAMEKDYLKSIGTSF
jgi:hypothetical protein